MGSDVFPKKMKKKSKNPKNQAPTTAISKGSAQLGTQTTLSIQ